jgi:transcriptional regulator with XRE-family HTH domain
LQSLLAQGLTAREVADRVGVAPSTVKKWLKRHGLETARAAELRASREALASGRDVVIRLCGRHGHTEFKRRRGTNAWRCLRCRSEAVAARRRRVKAILVADAGGRCVLCGYDRHVGALEFHHRDPSDKSFALGHTGVTRALSKARAEAAKCVLLCANCHAEVEGGVASLP